MVSCICWGESRQYSITVSNVTHRIQSLSLRLHVIGYGDVRGIVVAGGQNVFLAESMCVVILF